MTLPLRVGKHNQNALTIAEYLQQHQRLKSLLPRVNNQSGSPISQPVDAGFCGMLSLDVKGGDAAARQVIYNFKLIKLAPILGGAMIRLSVGLESETDIASDLD